MVFDKFPALRVYDLNRLSEPNITDKESSVEKFVIVVFICKEETNML